MSSFGIHALAHHVHRQRDHVDVAGAFAVAEQRAFDAVGAGHDAEFRGGDAGAPVVVRMQRQHDAIALAEIAVHPFDLVGVDIGRRDLDRRRQVDDGRVRGCRLPDIHHRLANLERVVEFGLREALGRILKAHLGTRHGRHQALDQPGAVDGDLLHALAAFAEDDAALRGRRRVVQVDDRLLRSPDGVESAADQLVARLGQDLDGDIVGDQAFVDDLADEGEIRVGRRWEADLDLLEAHAAERLEHAELALRSHRLDQRLVAVAQVDGAPDRAFGDRLRRPLPVRQVDRLEGFVFLHGHDGHGLNSSIRRAAL